MRLPILTLLLLGAAASPAAATQDVSYRAHYEVNGTWTESVRAGTDDSDADGDGREEVSSRDQDMRFDLASTIPTVAFRDGRLRGRAQSTDHELSLQIRSSSVTEPNGESGTCTVFDPGAGGAVELVAAGGGFVFRPAGDVIFQASCRTPMLEWPFHMNAQQKNGLDAPLPLVGRLGQARIEIPVAKDPAAACPVEDPGHTTACAFAWSGTVVLERLPGMVELGSPRLTRRGVAVDVTCAEACRPRLASGSARRRFSVKAGRRTRLVLPARRSKRITVTTGSVTRTLKVTR